MNGPRVFMDISFSRSPPERVVIELFVGSEPKAVENFRALCTGEKGIGKKTQKPLHYKGCRFYRVFDGLVVEGGDFENQNGTGGESIYGGTFSDEKMHCSRTGRGIILMGKHAPNEIGSQFLVCLKHDPFLDGHYVAVGKVIEGMKTFKLINRRALPGGKPFMGATITDCGEITKDNHVIVSGKPQTSSVVVRKEESKAKLKSYESSDEIEEEDVIELKQSLEEMKSFILKFVQDNKNERKKRSNPKKVDWPVLAASAAIVFLVGAFFRRVK